MSFLGDLLGFFGRLFPRDAQRYVETKAEQGSEDLSVHESVVDLLKALGKDSSMEGRRQLATECGYVGRYTGTAEQNVWLHGKVMEKVRRRELG